jgi:hypothetical protein
MLSSAPSDLWHDRRNRCALSVLKRSSYTPARGEPVHILFLTSGTTPNLGHEVTVRPEHPWESPIRIMPADHTVAAAQGNLTPAGTQTGACQTTFSALPVSRKPLDCTGDHRLAAHQLLKAVVDRRLHLAVERRVGLVKNEDRCILPFVCRAGLDGDLDERLMTLLERRLHSIPCALLSDSACPASASRSASSRRRRFWSGRQRAPDAVSTRGTRSTTVDLQWHPTC